DHTPRRYPGIRQIERVDGAGVADGEVAAGRAGNEGTNPVDPSHPGRGERQAETVGLVELQGRGAGIGGRAVGGRDGDGRTASPPASAGVVKGNRAGRCVGGEGTAIRGRIVQGNRQQEPARIVGRSSGQVKADKVGRVALVLNVQLIALQQG